MLNLIASIVLIIPAIPAIASFVLKAAGSFALYEALDFAFKRATGRGNNSGIDGTIWKVGPISFVPIAVYTVHDKTAPAYAILTMSSTRVDGKRLYRTYMAASGQSIILSSYDPELTKTFLSLGGPWVNMGFKNSADIIKFTEANKFNSLITWL